MIDTKTPKHLVPLEGHNNILINKLGEVFDTELGIYLNNLYVNKSGYRIFKNKYLHRLMAAQFVANPYEYDTVNHKDGDKLNNSASNLEWTSQSRNTAHANELDLTYKPNRKMTNEDYEYLLFERFFKGESILSISKTVPQEQAMLGVYFKEICESKGLMEKYNNEVKRQLDSIRKQRKGAKVPHRLIQRIDPLTNEVLEEYKTFSQPAKIYTGNSKNVNGIKRAVDRGTKYKDFFWVVKLIEDKQDI